MPLTSYSVRTGARPAPLPVPACRSRAPARASSRADIAPGTYKSAGSAEDGFFKTVDCQGWKEA